MGKRYKQKPNKENMQKTNMKKCSKSYVIRGLQIIKTMRHHDNIKKLSENENITLCGMQLKQFLEKSL